MTQTVECRWMSQLAKIRACCIVTCETNIMRGFVSKYTKEDFLEYLSSWEGYYSALRVLSSCKQVIHERSPTRSHHRSRSNTLPGISRRFSKNFGDRCWIVDVSWSKIWEQVFRLSRVKWILTRLRKNIVAKVARPCTCVPTVPVS